MYLHGSLAMGCFNPASSDLDLLVVMDRGMAPEQRRAAAAALLELSGQPRPVEISFLAGTRLHPWRHPATFELHYAEDWRARCTVALADPADPLWHEERRDPDLAAHVTIARARGVALLGPRPADVLPPVPAEDYRASILEDLVWALERRAEAPAYAVLNGCRVAAFLAAGLVTSKAEGAAWARAALPADLGGLIDWGAAVYRGERAEASVDGAALERFAAWAAGLAAAPGRGPG